MTCQHFNDSLHFGMGPEAAYLSALNELGGRGIAFFVVFGELCKCEARRIERVFAALFNLAQKLFDELARVSSTEGFALNVASFSKLIGEGDAGEYLPVRFEDRSGTRSAHLFHKKLHKQSARDATISRRLRQEVGALSGDENGFIFEQAAGRGNGPQRAADGFRTLLTSGSQVRVLLGSIPFPLNFHKLRPQTNPKFSAEVYLMGWAIFIGGILLIAVVVVCVRYAMRSTAKECVNIALAHASVEGVAERIADDIQERFGV